MSFLQLCLAIDKLRREGVGDHVLVSIRDGHSFLDVRRLQVDRFGCVEIVVDHRSEDQE